MHPSGFHFLPSAPAYFLALALVFAIAIALVEFLSHAYEKMGVNRRYVYLLLFFSLLGGLINIPIARLKAKPVVSEEDVTFRWMEYRAPVVDELRGTVLAINVGGAIIPTILSIYLIVKNSLYTRAVAGVAVVTVLVYLLATPVLGKGIAVPTFVPPIVAAAVAMLLSREKAAPLAYISGTLGTLIGADILNLGILSNLGASVASIGGAGTFDGVFLTGIIAVLLA
jgi:uncharacterized membrane protein